MTNDSSMTPTQYEGDENNTENGNTENGNTDEQQSAEGGISRAKRREMSKETLRHPNELTIARDGSYADDGRANLPLDERLVRGLLTFSDRDGRSDERRAYQHLQPVIVTLAGTDEAPSLIVTDGRQRLKAAAAINHRVSTIVPVWDACKHDRVRTRNALVSLARYVDATPSNANPFTGTLSGDAPAFLAHLSAEHRAALTWVSGLTMSEEIAALYVGGDLSGDKCPGLLRVTSDKKGAAVPYCLKVQYRDAHVMDAATLAISATLKNVQVDNLPSMEAEQIKRLMDVMIVGKDGKAERKYSDETIAGFLGCSEPTLHNKLLILAVEPAVRDALDEGKISWQAMRKGFFHSTGRGKVQPLAPSEQIDLLNEMLHRGISKSTDAISAGLVPAKPGPVVPAETQVVVNPPSVPAAARPPKAKPIRLIGDEGFFARAAARLAQCEEAATTLDNQPVDADTDAQALLDRRVNKSVVSAAHAIVLFLKNNDPSELDEFPDVKAALCAALDEPEEAPRKAARLTPAQEMADALRGAFDTWENTHQSERAEWPVGQGTRSLTAADVQEKIDQIADAYDKQDEEADKMIFAQTWWLENILGVATDSADAAA